jgi:hypothetical protein
MAKIRLDLDALSVESFDTGAGRDHRGTVRGHACTVGGTCYQRYCDITWGGPGTCAATEVNCSAGGTGGTGGGGGTGTYEDTCATGDQRICMCG